MAALDGASQAGLRKWRENYVKNDYPHSALREWRAFFLRRQTQGAMAGVAGILGIAGPFGTETFFSLVPRIGYWAAMVWTSYGVGLLAGHLIAPWIPRRWPVAVGVVSSGTVIGLAVTLAVFLVNFLVAGFVPDLQNLPGFVLTVIAIAIIVTALHQILEGRPDAPEAPPLLERLKLENRGRLVALSVEDHYVRVRTTAGEEMLLMRLGDAIREIGATDGLKVHRSHWVAASEITAARREGDRAILTMTHGPEIPVSRSNLAQLRDRGVLPR